MKLRARAAELQALKQVRRTQAHGAAYALRSPACALSTTVRAAYCAVRVCEVRHVCASPLPRAHCPARSDRLFCRITGRLVHMNEAAVLRHSEGKRFQTQLGAFALARLSGGCKAGSKT